MRLLGGLAVLLTLVACGRDPGTPFGVSASTEVRARFQRLCVDPITGESELPSDDRFAYVQSKGGGCMVVLEYDKATMAITGVLAVIDSPPADLRARIETIILPIVNEDMRRLIQKEVLSNLGVDKDIKIKRKGKGFLDYQHETHMPGYHSVTIRLVWH